MKILVADALIWRFADELAETTGPNVSWRFVGDFARPEMIEAIRDADVFVGSVLDDGLARAARRLRLLQVAGAGLDKVEIDALPHDVLVANTFHHGRSIAEHAVMGVLALERRLLESDAELRRGSWRSSSYKTDVPLFRTMREMTVGLVGYGDIGREAASLFGALGARLVVVRSRDRNVDPLPDGIAWFGGPERLDDLLMESDVVVLGLPLGYSTQGLIGRSELGRMRPDAILVNVARGAIVEAEALFEALQTGSIGGAVLDVWWHYPGGDGEANPAPLPFAELPNVVMTPHSSGNTVDTYSRRVADIAENVDRLRKGRPLIHAVTRPDVREMGTER